MKLRCGYCRKWFVPSESQARRSKQPSTIRSVGFMCSMTCAGLSSAQRCFERTGRKLSLAASAQHKLNAAVQFGILKRPKRCERCLKNPGLTKNGRSKLHGHHEDYTKPLEVKWLCVDCHMAISPRPLGERNHRAVLTVPLVRKIRKMTHLSGRETAHRLGVSHKCVKDVRSGVTWRHVL